MAGASDAVFLATRLNNVGFAEFTTTLISSVFNALVESSLRQMDAYIGLVNAVASTLEDFINNTQDDISLTDIGAFLAALGNIPEEQLKLLVGQSDPPAQNPPELAVADVGRLNTAVTLPATANISNDLGTDAISLDESGIKTIREAIARRIASNRFTLLQEMVRLGILRLVVDHGVIETRLTFSTYGHTTSTRRDLSQESNLSDDIEASGSTSLTSAGGVAGFIAGPVGAGIGIAHSTAKFDFSRSRDLSMNVSTTSSSDRDVVGSRVQIYGRVEIHFKTDFVPLNP